MPIYQNTEQLYMTMELLFNEVQSRDPNAADKVRKAKSLLRFKLSDPDASIVINGRRDPASFTFDDKQVRPEVDVKMTGNTFHHVLLGDKKLSKALANGDMKVKGPAYKALALSDLFISCQEIYPEILEQQGIDY